MNNYRVKEMIGLLFISIIPIIVMTSNLEWCEARGRDENGPRASEAGLLITDTFYMAVNPKYKEMIAAEKFYGSGSKKIIKTKYQEIFIDGNLITIGDKESETGVDGCIELSPGRHTISWRHDAQYINEKGKEEHAVINYDFSIEIEPHCVLLVMVSYREQPQEKGWACIWDGKAGLLPLYIADAMTRYKYDHKTRIATHPTNNELSFKFEK